MNKTIAFHIDYIREIMRQTSDDSVYSDELLYKLLIDSRAMVLGNKLNNFKRQSEFNYQDFCMELEVTKYDDCACVPGSGCLVLKTKLEVPEPLSLNFKTLMEVTTLDGQTRIDYVDQKQLKTLKFSKTRGHKLVYTIRNRKIVVFNSDLKLRPINIHSIVEDPSELANLPFIDITGTCHPTEKCFSKKTTPLPMDAKIADDVYQLVFKKLGLSMQQPADNNNDAESQTSNKVV